MKPVNGTALAVFILLFAVVTVMGFMASRWRRAEAESLEEWGLGGRGFGSVTTFFLLGGDCYSATTFVAVPGAMYATGAVNGYFVVLFTALAFVVVFAVYPRLWSVARVHGFITMADYVQARYDSKLLSLVIALTALVSVMPFIALQLVGVQSVLAVMGIGGTGSSWLARDLPLIIAFVILAAYTYSAGLRAPALIAFVKDALIWIVVIAALVYLPIKLGGFGHMFSAAEEKFSSTGVGSLVPQPGQYWVYASLAVGQGLMMFLFPHSMTGLLAAKSRNTLRRNAGIMPVYSILLGGVGFLGLLAIASGVDVTSSSQAAPALFGMQFSPWFAGVAYATIAIAALVPAAIMSIAAANLFTRNIYRAFFRPAASPAEETRVSKLVSLFVKLGAMLFILALNSDYTLNLQLIGGIWLLQVLPTVLISLFTRWFHRWALLAGWLAGVVYGTVAAYDVTDAVTGRHFAGSVAEIPFLGISAYIALPALVINLAVAVVVTVVLRALRVGEGLDRTSPEDYLASGEETPNEAVKELVDGVVPVDPAQPAGQLR
jgi:SSS family solute:Na+ symporter